MERWRGYLAEMVLNGNQSGLRNAARHKVFGAGMNGRKKKKAGDEGATFSPASCDLEQDNNFYFV